MEAMERRGSFAVKAAIMFVVLWSQCNTAEAQRNNSKMSYVCPPDYIRLGHSCYYFSEKELSWNDAFFDCTDRAGNLTVPARWEDRNLRNYLTKQKVAKANRWIGGIYEYKTKQWRWGGDLREMHYQSFSKMKPSTPEELQFHCIAMIPEILYRWAPKLCIEPQRYICQAKLLKVTKTKVRGLKRRWQRMGKINEINAPNVSRENNDPIMVNDVAANPNPKSYDLRPNQIKPPKRHGPRRMRMGKPGVLYSHNVTGITQKQKRLHNMKGYDPRPNLLKKRGRPAVRRRLKRPFPGYSWNRHDPEGSYQRNAELLRSGRTGLTPQQVNTHLARLRHLRDRQINRQKRLREKDDWLVNEPRNALSQTHPRTYTIDNNISALHPKTIVEEFDMMLPPQPVALPLPKGG